MARKTTVKLGSRGGREGRQAREDRIQGARLEPVGKVQRALVSPAGSVVVVEVPVYPPFRLDSDDEAEAGPGKP